MSTEDDLREMHERTVDNGVARLMEMFEKGGDYMPLIEHLFEALEDSQVGTTALLAMCFEKGLFTPDEYKVQRARTAALLDQMGAATRDDMIKTIKKRLGGTDGP